MAGFREQLSRIRENIGGRWTSVHRWIRKRPLQASPTVVKNRSQPSASVQPLDFNGHIRHVRELLKTLPGSSPEIMAAVKDLRACSAKPPVEIVDGQVWGVESDQLFVKTHLKSEFKDAMDRLTVHDRVLSSNDQYYLRSILSHTCGWSPTAKEHSQDAWMRYLQAEYAHLENLQPILDSFTWQEELDAIDALSFEPPEPWLFLLATANSFYVYDFENRSMCPAGMSLEEVYTGLKDARYRGDKEGDWDEEPRSLDINPADYFPVYIRSREGMLVPQNALKEFNKEII
jgi:hypothetical protein